MATINQQRSDSEVICLVYGWILRMKSMHYVYILRSVNQKKFYIGYTTDLDRRINEHSRGQNYTTQRMDEAELIFYEAFKNESDARRREGYFKTTKGKKTLKLMLQETLCPVV